jgi:uncharacterized membrane protein
VTVEFKPRCLLNPVGKSLSWVNLQLIDVHHLKLNRRFSKLIFFMTQIQVIAVGALPFCQLAIAQNTKTEIKQKKNSKLMFSMAHLQQMPIGIIPFCQLAIVSTIHYII